MSILIQMGKINIKALFLLRHDYEPCKVSSKGSLHVVPSKKRQASSSSFARIISLNHFDSTSTPTTPATIPFTPATSQVPTTPFPSANPADHPKVVDFPPPSFLDAMDTTHSM